MRKLALALAIVAASCADGQDTDHGPPPVDTDAKLAFFVGADDRANVDDMIARVGSKDVVAIPNDDPAGVVGRGAGRLRIGIVRDALCSECFRIEGGNGKYFLRSGGALGTQYGVAQILEDVGVRFYHPFASRLPDALGTLDGAPSVGKTFSPEKSLRGLHLHTLHPIESYFALWEPSDANLERAKSIVDWLVKSRGNYLEWTGLNDIEDDAKLAAWRAHTKRIVDYAHARGVKVGIGIELLGTSNLQRAFDLLAQAKAADAADQIENQLHRAMDGIGWDHVNLSFGEFSGADPEVFVDDVNLAWAKLEEVAPGTRMDATVHVGNYPKLRVTYMGESLLYYFLVKFADPHVVPWVHTVMYYDLFEDAGGAYAHDDFSEHRQFLLDRLASGLPVGYFPETAYWVDFDDSVPTYLPLYVRSRWLDLSSIRAASTKDLGEHVLFSTGWEWGYWQNDYASLRNSYSLSAKWSDVVEDAFRPYGAQGEAISAAIELVAELEHGALIQNRLAPYLAGRDQIIDLGEKNGIVAAPTRPSFEAVAAMADPARMAFGASVVMGLWALGDAIDGARTQAVSAGVDASDPWLGETLDGMEITARRARWVGDLYAAVLASVEGSGDGGFLAKADAELDAAKIVVARRHASLHDPIGRRLIDDGKNATIYGYGYLHFADSLCYWERERVQASNVTSGTSASVPSCVE